MYGQFSTRVVRIVSLFALSVALAPLAEIVEPYLLKIGFIAREPRGRRVTREAYAHLHRQPPAGATGQGALFE